MDCVGTVKNRGLRKGDEKEDKGGERRRGEERREWGGFCVGLALDFEGPLPRRTAQRFHFFFDLFFKIKINKIILCYESLCLNIKSYVCSSYNTH